MVPMQAISTGFRKTFVCSGRATRSEFWWFAPVALVLPIVTATQLKWQKAETWGIWQLFVVMVACVPLLSAMSRRLQDTGEEGRQAFYPFMPLIILWLGYQVTYWLGLVLLAGSGFGILFLGLFVIVLITAALLIGFITSALVAANVLGMMLVASDPQSNRFGAPEGGVTP
ncbi:DUF805 domain-containing protein [Ruegeria sp. HKCCD7559]|uniref:DUF805 domain-containing protein n=1 Tax=Ruegeria sp. HKCCD7559 TaxID=2683005 RepID=UPI0014921853|nr:DUF805 domain-containing protein [Ruegeria sp. HKCCD7559]NOC46228.1 DUF805 domain-containing protein [Ruegeria sp. HKCCD7559]